MWQEIIVYVIISLAVLYSLFALFYHSKWHNKKACNSNCAECKFKSEYCENLSFAPTMKEGDKGEMQD